MQTRIMLVEDRADFRYPMAAWLGREPDLEVVAQAGPLAEACHRAAFLSFDVAVLDIGLPDGNGADLIGDLRATNPDVAVLNLSASLDPEILKRATEAGAEGILDKLASSAEIVSTIRCLGVGKRE